MESEIWSQILSGWPSVTDSDVKKYFPFLLMGSLLRRWSLNSRTKYHKRKRVSRERGAGIVIPNLCYAIVKAQMSVRSGAEMSMMRTALRWTLATRPLRPGRLRGVRRRQGSRSPADPVPPEERPPGHPLRGRFPAGRLCRRRLCRGPRPGTAREVGPGLPHGEPHVPGVRERLAHAAHQLHPEDRGRVQRQYGVRQDLFLRERPVQSAGARPLAGV